MESKEGNEIIIYQSEDGQTHNLDMIISLGYRIRSKIATHFRRWATERLTEYIRLNNEQPIRIYTGCGM